MRGNGDGQDDRGDRVRAAREASAQARRRRGAVGRLDRPRLLGGVPDPADRGLQLLRRGRGHRDAFRGDRWPRSASSRSDGSWRSTRSACTRRARSTTTSRWGSARASAGGPAGSTTAARCSSRRRSRVLVGWFLRDNVLAAFEIDPIMPVVGMVADLRRHRVPDPRRRGPDLDTRPVAPRAWCRSRSSSASSST